MESIDVGGGAGLCLAPPPIRGNECYFPTAQISMDAFSVATALGTILGYLTSDNKLSYYQFTVRGSTNPNAITQTISIGTHRITLIYASTGTLQTGTYPTTFLTWPNKTTPLMLACYGNTSSMNSPGSIIAVMATVSTTESNATLIIHQAITYYVLDPCVYIVGID